MRLTIATSYFPVDADILRNLRYVLNHMRSGKKSGADVIHFPECALSGYAGADFRSYKGFDWKTLEDSTREVLLESRRLGIWTILGSSHRLTGSHKPHNSLYIIDSRGDIVDRYDKMFCAGDRSGREGDLAHYSPGDHFCTFRIKGVRCGTLICHEFRYPELYREYRRKNVELIFHSYHAGHIPPRAWKAITSYVGSDLHSLNPSKSIPGITMPATMHSMAANNFMWISCSNTSARQSCWPSFFIRPDGVMTGKLRLHVAGVLISRMETSQRWYDSTEAWRGRAMRGVFHSGKLVKDPRSRARTAL